jgi:hypothetical protein
MDNHKILKDGSPIRSRHNHYPATWKTSKITLIVKTNNPCGPADYRPISILPSNLSKAMEIIMKRDITGHIENNRMMSCYQSGFVQNIAQQLLY